MKNKEKIRMNSQLTQALSDTVKREEQLKKQCDQLLESLHSALGEDEKLALRIAQMEENAEFLQKLVKTKEEELNKLKGELEGKVDRKNFSGSSGRRISDLAKLLENDTEKGGTKWKQLKYSHIEGLSDKENFEMLRKVVEHRDRTHSSNSFSQSPQEKDFEAEVFRSSSISKDLLLADIDSRKQSVRIDTLEDALADRDSDIKDLLKDYNALQTQYEYLEKQKSDLEQEVLDIREKLAYKSNQLVNIYQSQEFNSQIPEEFNSLRMQYLELVNTNQLLHSQIAAIKSRGSECSALILQYLQGSADKEALVRGLEETFQCRLALEVEGIEGEVLNELRKRIGDLEKANLDMWMQNECLRVDTVALRNLLDEEKKIEKEAKGNKNEWKRYKREHVARIEKIYQEQIVELKGILGKIGGNFREKEKKFVELSKKYENEIRELTTALKKEHESKKLITECFAKEKEFYEKFKESSMQNKFNDEILTKKYNEAKAALEESNKKIFRLEQALSKNMELEENIQNKEKIYIEQIEESESIRAKLYNEITRLNKQIQESEQERNQIAMDRRSNMYFCEESNEALTREIGSKDMKIEELRKENAQLKKEIFEIDYKHKSCENELDKLQALKKKLPELQKNSAAYETLSKELESIESENAILREDIRNYQSTIHQLKIEVKTMANELLDIQNELALSYNSQKALENTRKDTQSSSNLYKEELSNIQSRLTSISKEFQIVKQELDKANEDKSSLAKAKKQLESENASLKSRISGLMSQPKEVSSEITNIKEKVQEIEMKYESLEACQDEMILTVRKIYKDWCANLGVPSKRFNNIPDPTREAVGILESIINDAKQIIGGRQENIVDSMNEYLRKCQTLLKNIENEADSLYRSHCIKLISENIQLKQEIMEKHKKAWDDERLFSELHEVKGINDWVLQKWKDSEKDITRLREQLLQVTLELEKRIKLAKESPQDLQFELEKAKAQIESLKRKSIGSDLEYLSSEKEYYKQRNIELEQEISKLNHEISDKKPHTSYKSHQDSETWKKSFMDLYAKLSGRYPESEHPQTLTNLIIGLFNSQKDKQAQGGSYEDYMAEIAALKNQIEYYRNRVDIHTFQKDNKKLEEIIINLKNKEAVLEKRHQEMQSRQSDSGLIFALYEEKKIREELEEELTEKCNLIEKVLMEYEENKKYLKL